MAGTAIATHYPPDGRRATGIIKVDLVGDASTGAFPATILPAFGGRLQAVQTNPGSPAPTDNYDITLIDGDGLDRLVGLLANRDTSTSERVGITGAPVCGYDEQLTLTIANNSVASAVLSVTLFYDIAGSPEAGTAQLPAALGAGGGLKTSPAPVSSWRSISVTTAQTGAAVWTPASGKTIVITSVEISSKGVTAGDVVLWFGASGDTTYSEGTDQPVWKGSFVPSAATTPGMIANYVTPKQCANADYLLRLTTSADISLQGVIYGYEV